jgi:hypothetical protein
VDQVVEVLAAQELGHLLAQELPEQQTEEVVAELDLVVVETEVPVVLVSSSSLILHKA